MRYVEINTEWGLEKFFVCQKCGSIVEDMEMHEAWHKQVCGEHGAEGELQTSSGS